MKKILLVLISVLTLCACEDPSNYLETPKCRSFNSGFPDVSVCSMPDGVVCYVAHVGRGGGISCIKTEQRGLK